ncbi:MAG: tetratricopeptide repeat protein [Betaproteobacteria bacterium]
MEKLKSETEKSIQPFTANTALSFLLLSCFFVAISLWSSIATSQTATDASTCDTLAIRWDEAPGLGSRLERAKALEEQGKSCIGKGIYNLILAILYMDAGDFNSADRIAKQGILKGSPYQANLHQVLAETTLRRGNVDAAYKMAEDIAKKNPSYVPILGFLGEIDSKNQNWAMALKRAQKWNEIDNSALSLLAMASALHQLDRHEECITAVYKAVNIDPARIARTGGIKEAIFSLGILKRNQEAAELLKRHIRANPNWRQDASMVNAARALGLTN